MAKKIGSGYKINGERGSGSGMTYLMISEKREKDKRVGKDQKKRYRKSVRKGNYYNLIKHRRRRKKT